MTGSLQRISWNFGRSFSSMVIIASIAGSILVADLAYCDTPPAAGAADAYGAEPAPCPADGQYVAPGEVSGELPRRFVPCARQEAGAECQACATCGSGAWCAPVKTRGMGPRSPGGGPDD